MRLFRWSLGALAIAAAATLVVVGLIGFGGAVQAAGPRDGEARRALEGARMAEVLAQKLGISVEQLKNVQLAAKNESIDQMIKDGKLTPEQGNRLKNREGSAGFSFAGRGGASTYETLLAQKLGKTVAELGALQTAARNQVVDELVMAGKLTPEQANKLKSIQPGQARQRVEGAMRKARENGALRGIVRGVGNLLEATADKLGIDRRQLFAELRGKSLAQVAQAHGVSRDALKSTIVSQAKAELDAAVASKSLTREQADKVFDGLSRRIDQLLDRVHDERERGQRPNVPRPRNR